MHSDQSNREAMQTKEVAQLLVDDNKVVADMVDPRTPAFARMVVEELVTLINASPGIMRRALQNANDIGHSLNVAKLHGIIECMQNADDVRATEMRIALRRVGEILHLLIIHNGKPVTFHHVLSMAMPFLTTKTNDATQRGRFGIGLKTLKRIASNVAVHSAPYHFSGDLMSFGVVDQEDVLPGLYDPAVDTMLVVTLNGEVTEEEFVEWFDEWSDDGLLFLTSVSAFRFCNLDGSIRAERRTGGKPWLHNDTTGKLITRIQHRLVTAGTNQWTVWRATINVPEGLHPAHKVRTDTTDISIAIPHHAAAGTLCIGFKTTVPVKAPFSIDAQFDPGTSRETLIENKWNDWLIAQTGTVLGMIALVTLKVDPVRAWYAVPCDNEHIGTAPTTWIGQRFARVFKHVRDVFVNNGKLMIGEESVSVDDLCYEHSRLTELLTAEDIRAVQPNKRAIPHVARDTDGRWRRVADNLDEITLVSKNRMLDGFQSRVFNGKSPDWWVAAGKFVIDICVELNEEPFDGPFLLSDEMEPIICVERADDAAPVLIDVPPTRFGVKWKLFERLHPHYSACESGHAVIAWLVKESACTSRVTTEMELRAFARRYAAQPVKLDDEALRDLRDRFDDLPASAAEEIGPLVGAAILIDGFEFKAGKKVARGVSPVKAYLSAQLDKPSKTNRNTGNWPIAAASSPSIKWINGRYADKLPTGGRRAVTGRQSRGTLSFLMLLGAEVAPRLVETGSARGVGATRLKDLEAIDANAVYSDYQSPELAAVLAAIVKAGKKDRKTRSAALLRALSRRWSELYADSRRVEAAIVPRSVWTHKGTVPAHWLVSLRETAWVAIANGELRIPSLAVIKSPETQEVYNKDSFVVGVTEADVHKDLASDLGLIMTGRASELMIVVRNVRNAGGRVDAARVLRCYRNLAGQNNKASPSKGQIGNLSHYALRTGFSEGDGLVYVGNNQWRKPADVFRGADIFRRPDKFVPSNPGLEPLWDAMQIRPPTVDQCITFCRDLAAKPYTVDITASLIDTYRYMEDNVSEIERRTKERLRNMPLSCGEYWESRRPVYFVENTELRDELVRKQPDRHFWTPPCDPSGLPKLMGLLGVMKTSPSLKVVEPMARASHEGESLRARFMAAVEHLSAELARNDLATREKINIPWDQLKDVPLYVYDQPFAVRCADDVLGGPVAVRLNALMAESPREFHVVREAIDDRDFGGRAVAMLFKPEVRHHVEAEWVVAWQKSRGVAAAPIRLASDAERLAKLQREADELNAANRGKGKVDVKAQNKNEEQAKPRVLKKQYGDIGKATVHPGKPSKQGEPRNPAKPTDNPPEPNPKGDSGNMAAPRDYSTPDLENHGWQVLTQVLTQYDGPELQDWRARRGIGADGSFDWKRFVEMKSTGDTMQSSIEMSTVEYERAMQCGEDYILALVYGLEEGKQAEVRLIFDPAHNVAMRPTRSVTLTGLADAPCIIIPIADGYAPDTGRTAA